MKKIKLTLTATILSEEPTEEGLKAEGFVSLAHRLTSDTEYYQQDPYAFIEATDSNPNAELTVTAELVEVADPS